MSLTSSALADKFLINRVTWEALVNRIFSSNLLNVPWKPGSWLGTGDKMKNKRSKFPDFMKCTLTWGNKINTCRDSNKMIIYSGQYCKIQKQSTIWLTKLYSSFSISSY